MKLVLLLALASFGVAQANGPANQAVVDGEGSIHVASRDGKLIRTSRPQVDDEPDRMSPSLKEERVRWLANILQEIRKIQPGMQRRALIPSFTTEGGLSNRLHRTYVFAECPILKVDIQFRAADHTKNALSEEDPLDTIESVSAPYLAGSVYD